MFWGKELFLLEGLEEDVGGEFFIVVDDFLVLLFCGGELLEFWLFECVFL